MRQRLQMLIACVVLALSACSTAPSMQQTNWIPPDACATACPELPSLTSGEDAQVRLWEAALIDTAAQCRRLHSECRQGALRHAQAEAGHGTQ